jgi:YegS/Rv2252/BmrU family lipid kinase
MPGPAARSGTTVILNPNAGKGKGKAMFTRVEKLLKAQGLAFDVFETTGPGHATELARTAVARNCPLVVAVGGDGTVRETVNGLVGSSAVMGIVPIGSGNDFIKSTGIPRDLASACAVVKNGRVREFDLGRIGPTCFANAVGVGYDALVVVEANRIRWLRGLPLYLAAVLRAIVRFDCPLTSIELLDVRPAQVKDRTVLDFDTLPAEPFRRWDQAILLIACANGHHYGGGFHIAPGARADDGWLEVCVIDHVTRLQILEKLLYVIKGTHAQLPEVRFYRARRIRLKSKSVLYVQADGDLLPEADPHELEIEVLPKALKLLVP